METLKSKSYYGTQIKYKKIAPTNRKGSRFALYVAGEKIKEVPYNYSMGETEQFVETLKSYFGDWCACIITNDKQGLVANITMGTEI